MAGEWVQVEGSQYQDLGQVLTAGAIAAGAQVYESTVHTGLQWVRNIITQTQCDQTFNVVAQRYDSAMNNDWGTSLGVSSTATATNSWNPGTVGGVNGLLGFGVKFGIKNTSASASTVGNLRVQLMGQ